MYQTYNGLEFKTTLQATWAAFFDLAGWKWWINPVSVNDWKADFKVSFLCTHSECSGSHTLFISVLPIPSIESNINHPSQKHHFSVKDSNGNYLADSGALFGDNPDATIWQMAHGAGGGVENLRGWVPDADILWKQAINIVKENS